VTIQSFRAFNFAFKRALALIRSEGNRHRLRWFIAFVAVLSVASATGALAISNGNSHSLSLLAQRSGAQALSASELVNLVKEQKLVAYWLGPVSGSKYTLVASGNGLVTITYLSDGAGIDNPFQNNLVIETASNGNLKGALVAPSTEIDNAKVGIVTGNTFSYDKYIMDHMTVQLKEKQRQVLVFYPQLHSALSMQTDAEALLSIG